jgi:DNA-directed RNA polymerase beta subunit
MIESILLNPQLRRKNFGKRPTTLEIPDLVELPKSSYSTFLQKDVPPEKRKNIGLQQVFKSVFPIKDFNEDASWNSWNTVWASRSTTWTSAFRRG